jgi:hypothetical protein
MSIGMAYILYLSHVLVYIVLLLLGTCLPTLHTFTIRTNAEVIFVKCSAREFYETLYSKCKFVPTNALLLFTIFLRYGTLFQHISIRIGIILRDTFKS